MNRDDVRGDGHFTARLEKARAGSDCPNDTHLMTGSARTARVITTHANAGPAPAAAQEGDPR